MFNTNVFDRAEIAVTATEKRLDQEQVYNVLTPYADNWSKIYTFFSYVHRSHYGDRPGLDGGS